MRGSARRVLRSPEITLVASKSVVGPLNGAANSSGPGANTESTTLPAATSAGTCSVGSGGCVPIDVNCSIQYSHWLNRDANILQILLQRRKKYKSKTVNLGYKTLAYCNVNLSQVLQRRIENRFLELYTDPNCSSLPVGRVEVQCLSTAPLEKDLLNGKRKVLDEDEEYALPDVYSEDSDHAEESDEDQIAEIEEGGHSRQKKLVKAMSVGEDLDPTETCKLWDEIDLMTTVSDIEEEDSDADGTDTISIQSTPKPILRPFFATTGGSDDTLGADAGTKLLRRLHRQLVASGEAEVSGESGLRGVFPPIGASQNSEASKKVTPITTSSFLLTTISRAGNPSGIRHRRGVSLTGGRLAKRFAHMGRRSNPAGSGKHHPIGMDVPKSLESSTVPSSAFDVSDNGVVGKSTSPAKLPGAENLSDHDSSDEGSPSNERPARLSRSGYQNKADILSTSLDGDSLAAGGTQSTIAAAYGRQQQAMLRISPTSPTLTSTPDLHRARDPLNRESQAQESLFSQCTLQHEIDKLPPGSIEKLKQVVFLVNQLEPGGKVAVDLLRDRDLRIVTITSYAETKQLFTRLVTDVQSQNRRASIDDVVKVCILGGNALVNFVLRAYVDQLSSRSAELAAAFRFFVVPVSGLTKPRQSSCDLQRVQHHQVQQQQLQQQRTPVKTGRSRPVSEVPSSYLDAWTDVDYRFALNLDGSGSLCSENNLLACQLCKLDPKYALLFSDLCVESAVNDASVISPTTPSAQTPAQSNLTEEQPNDLDFFDRCLVYLSSSRNIVSIPIGACLLGLASAATTQPVSRPHKQSQCTEFVGNYPPGFASAPLECSQSIPTDNLSNVVGNLSKTGVSSGSTGLNEELLMPFLLTVRLGSIPNHSLPTQALTRSGTGDPVMPSTSGSAAHNTSDLGSVLSDPEASTGSAKRSLSPEYRSQTAVASPNSSFRRKRFHRCNKTECNE
ncbi:hypothetical protein PHET_05660 [Paragonimus heterotremus]|uniref:Uncharacterized protein n=1 Tax=Paragonimus heterotremus TaxID=100268 RepID=A0A8J4WZY7_9TREM|nr:hypothetical protein PHET_05660 [Paragonimus heterotremus]